MINDKNSAEWLHIKKFCEDQLTKLHEDNEADLDTAETAHIRGQIKFAKKILALENNAEQKIEVKDQSYL